MRRTVTALLAAGLLVVPAAPGWAQEPEPESATEAGEVLADWTAQLSELAELLLGEHDADLPLSDEDRAAWRALFDQLLEGLEVEFMVAQAMAETDGQAEDEALEAEDEADEADDTDEADDAEADHEVHGEIVRTVAQCAPRGREGKDFLSGAKNHGAWVSAVARGDEISLSVPTIVRDGDAVSLGEPTDVVLTVATVEDAETLCDALAAIAEAKALQDELDAASDDAETLPSDDDHPGKSQSKDKGKGKANDAKPAKPEHAASGRPAHAGPKGERGGDQADLDDTEDDDTEDDDTEDDDTEDDDTEDDEAGDS